MGGGDLNLKKSWHPSTMKNMERVWKAEQKDTEEKKRIAELQKEIISERSKEELKKFAQDTGVIKKDDGPKLEWMYKGPSQAVNNEEYLLGKAVDKNFETSRAAETPSTSYVDNEGFPNALRYASASALEGQIDVIRKLNEDPLMAINKKTMEMRKQLYNNPVKMKQMQQLVSSYVGKNKKKHKKKSKKSHKNSKSDSDDEKKLDALLASKYNKLRGEIQNSQIFHKLNESENSDSDDSQVSKSKNRKNYTKRNSPYNERQKSFGKTDADRNQRFRSRSRSPANRREDKRDFYRNYEKRPYNQERGKEHESQYTKKRGRSRSPKDSPDKYSKRKDNESKASSGSNKRSPDRRRSVCSSESDDSDSKRELNLQRKYSRKSDDDENKPARSKRFGLTMADGSKPVPSSRPAVKKDKPVEPPKSVQKPRFERKKLTEEELERKRKEMMDNASWRDREREANVKRYRQEDQWEQKQQKDFDKDFMRKQLSRATADATVEGRIKSKVNNIQRSKMAMDSNFARR